MMAATTQQECVLRQHKKLAPYPLLLILLRMLLALAAEGGREGYKWNGNATAPYWSINSRKDSLIGKPCRSEIGNVSKLDVVVGAATRKHTLARLHAHTHTRTRTHTHTHTYTCTHLTPNANSFKDARVIELAHDKVWGKAVRGTTGVWLDAAHKRWLARSHLHCRHQHRQKFNTTPTSSRPLLALPLKRTNEPAMHAEHSIVVCACVCTFRMRCSSDSLKLAASVLRLPLRPIRRGCCLPDPDLLLSSLVFVSVTGTSVSQHCLKTQSSKQRYRDTEIQKRNVLKHITGALFHTCAHCHFAPFVEAVSCGAAAS